MWDTCVSNASVSEMQDTCGIHVGYMYPERQSRYMLDTSGIHARYMMRYMYLIMYPERHVSDMKETCGIHTGYMQDTCILRGNHDTYGIHKRFMRDTCGIHAGYVSRVSGGMYRCHHHVQRTYQATHCLLVCKWVFSSPLELPHHLLCHGNPYPCWFTTLVEGEAHRLFLILMCFPMYPICISLVS